MRAVAGETTFSLKICNFDPNGSEFSRSFKNSLTADEFVKLFDEAMDRSTNTTSDTFTSVATSTPKPLKQVQRKTKSLSMDATMKELISPPKKLRGKSYDDEIASHHLGISD